MHVVDLKSEQTLESFPAGEGPTGVALADEGRALVVTNINEGRCRVLDALSGSIIGSIQVGAVPASRGDFVQAGPIPSSPLPSPSATPTPTQTCAADCNGDLDVSIGELIAAVGIALGRAPLESCGNADVNRDGFVSVSDLIAGVRSLLDGCINEVGVSGRSSRKLSSQTRTEALETQRFGG